MTVLHGFLLGLMVCTPSELHLSGLYHRGEVTGRPSTTASAFRCAAERLSCIGSACELCSCVYLVSATPRKLEPEPYRAFIIGPNGLAIAVCAIVAGFDHEALEKAMQLQGELRIELWCGSRKVADKTAPPLVGGGFLMAICWFRLAIKPMTPWRS
jgi:hypothetical protein